MGTRHESGVNPSCVPVTCRGTFSALVVLSPSQPLSASWLPGGEQSPSTLLHHCLAKGLKAMEPDDLGLTSLKPLDKNYLSSFVFL